MTILRWNIDRNKLVGYLLNPEHEDGASKAKYLAGYGFTAADPEALAFALGRHAFVNMPGRRVQIGAWPPRQVFEGPVPVDGERLMGLRTVWEWVGPDELRFLSAVPRPL